MMSSYGAKRSAEPTASLWRAPLRIVPCHLEVAATRLAGQGPLRASFVWGNATSARTLPLPRRVGAGLWAVIRRQESGHRPLVLSG